MTLFFLLLPLLSAVCYIVLPEKFDSACRIGNWVNFALVALTLYAVLNSHDMSLVSFELLSLPQINLNLLFDLDPLSLSMLLLISLISFVVNRYATRYVYSDLNRSRFMFQLSLVTFSVIFLVLSANLLTAFIGWQLIGFHLYWLLNHYHYDEQANRAAKKKFVINRIGDISFLLAVIISLYYYSTTDFKTLFTVASPTLSILHHFIPIRTIILSCVFMAVMTKSAQFPFHIWLPDTMQTPTPVSAMMHAGVINAGGFLLVRLAPGLVAVPNLLIFISGIGLITLVLGNLFSLTQPDIKKQLAYSTLSQMGYMVLQCGLGCFAGAIFHLISHGFFKAWSFLNSGNQLIISQTARKKPKVNLELISLFISLLVVFISAYMNHSFHALFFSFPLLLFFLALTLYQLIVHILNEKATSKITCISIVLIIAMFVIYINLITGYDRFLQAGFPTITKPPISQFQYLIIATILFFYLAYGLLKSKKSYAGLISRANYLIQHKLFIEENYRRYLIEPMRSLGDRLYQFFIGHKIIAYYIIGLLLLLPLFKFYPFTVPSLFNYSVDVTLLIIFLITANRARELKHIFLFLMLSQYTLALIALQFKSINSIKIAYFQFINITLLSLLMLMVLHKIKSGQKLSYTVKNNLPWLGAYLTAILFCLIGLPFTSTFMSEVIILKEVILHPALVLAILFVIVLFAISILHALQDHVFKFPAILRLSIQLSRLEHAAFIGILFFNFLNGLYPSYILKLL